MKNKKENAVKTEKNVNVSKEPKAPQSVGAIVATVFKVLLHLAGFPLLAALTVVLSISAIKTGSTYGVFAFVGLIVVALMAIIYYLAYFLVRTKKSRSIRNQTIIVAIVAMCSLSGFWMLVDGLAADALESATSSTIRWEDLSDNWEARGEVNHQLLVDYVTVNYNLGRLKSPKGETIDDYVKQGPKNKELADLLKVDFEDIDGDGYASFKGPSVDYAQDDRMTIPALLHLFLDDRSSMQAHVQMPVAYYYNAYYTALIDESIKEQYQEKIDDACYDIDLDATLTDEVKATKKNEVTAQIEKERDEYIASLKVEGNHVIRIYHGYTDVGSVRTKAFLITDDELNLLQAVTSVNIVGISYSEQNADKGRYFSTHSEQYVDEGVQKFRTEYEWFKTQEEAIDNLKTKYECGDNYFVGSYRMASVGWHVLDMLGEGMDMDMSGLFSEELMATDVKFEVSGISVKLANVGALLASDLLPDTFALVADMLNEPEMLGSPLYITLNTTTGELSLEPSNAHRGVLGYMQIAWLNNNGMLYLLVTFFSVRTLFYIYGPVMVIITLLLGVVREQEIKRRGKKPVRSKEVPIEEESALETGAEETSEDVVASEQQADDVVVDIPADAE